MSGCTPLSACWYCNVLKLNFAVCVCVIDRMFRLRLLHSALTLLVFSIYWIAVEIMFVSYMVFFVHFVCRDLIANQRP